MWWVELYHLIVEAASPLKLCNTARMPVTVRERTHEGN